ncbi:MAG: glycosyltransferase, partial [Geminicoccaceae bacterium]|nr:glycosyltransferase [Geminicoccaceae bacterium]
MLIVNRVAFTGGVERTILTLIAQLEALGFEPVLAAPPNGDLVDAARARGVEIAPCPFDRMRISADPRVLMRYPGVWRDGARAVERHCRERRIDLIHAHHPVGALYARRAVRRLGVPMILHVHETLPARRLYALAMRAVLPDAALVVCVSSAAAELALALGASPNLTRIVPNGVDGR